MNGLDQIAEQVFGQLKEPIANKADAERIVDQLFPEADYQSRSGLAQALWHLSMKRYFPVRGQAGVVWV